MSALLIRNCQCDSCTLPRCPLNPKRIHNRKSWKYPKNSIIPQWWCDMIEAFFHLMADCTESRCTQGQCVCITHCMICLKDGGVLVHLVGLLWPLTTDLLTVCPVQYCQSGNSSWQLRATVAFIVCRWEQEQLQSGVCVAVKAGQAVLFVLVALTPLNRLSTVGANGLSFHCQETFWPCDPPAPPASSYPHSCFNPYNANDWLSLSRLW